MTPVKSCQACKWCVDAPSKIFHEAVCIAVVDPFSGEPMPVTIARQEQHPTHKFSLPCGYIGALWQAKE